MRISGWWRGRTSVERFDMLTRWPLYLISGAEPLVAILMLIGHPHGQPWANALLMLVTTAHTLVCLALLQASLAHYLDEDGPIPAPIPLLIAVAVALTVAGIAAGVVAFPPHEPSVVGGWPGSFAVTLLFCSALTAAATPLLPARRLLIAVALPSALLAIVQAALMGASIQGVWSNWAVYYVLLVGDIAFIYRASVWYLGIVWQIERSRDAQSRLAVAEERLRVARDLHDTLGRNLALIAINSDLAAELVRRGETGAIERMLMVRQAAQDSMREVRDVVGGRRHAALDAELAGARAILRSAGISTRVIGDGAGLPPDVQAALGWVVREATTNIIRHSDPATVTIDLEVTTDADAGPSVVLRIENDGVHQVEPGGVKGGETSGERRGEPGGERTVDLEAGRREGPIGGTGLAGLRIRLADLGGTVTAEKRPGGRFRVQARIPLHRTVPASTRPEPTTAEPTSAPGLRS